MITSENGLKINQTLNTVTALKNAHIYQKNDHIKAEEIVLTYKKDSYNKNQIVKAEAYTKAQAFQGEKTVKAEKMILYKEKADILKSLDGLKKYADIKLPNEVAELLDLEKDVLIKEKEQLILADKMYILYKNIVAGKNTKSTPEVEKMIAIGNVKASNGQNRIQGDWGIYNPATDTMDLYGKVSLHQGNSHLNGTWANMNLKTGLSTLKSYENDKVQSRIKGSLIPADFEKESEEK